MSSWHEDWDFKRIARLIWPDDTRISLNWQRRPGKKAADERMQRRYEGYETFSALVSMHREIVKCAALVAQGLK